MNQEQAKASVRWAVTTFGSAIAGFVAGKGWVSADTVMSVLTSEIFLSGASAVAMLVWGLFAHTQKNAVAVVATIAEDPASPVKGVITTDTLAGRDLARDIPSETVKAAGSQDAKNLATSGAPA